MNKNFTIDLRQKILQQIKTGRITVRPKSVFIIRKLSLKAVLILLLLSAVLILSFVFFTVSQLPGAELLGQNDKALWSIWSRLPIGLILLVIIMIPAVIFINRRFTFAYRRSIKLSLINLIVILILVSGLVSYSGFHQGLAAQASTYDSIFLKSVYHQALSCDFDKEHLLIGQLLDYNRQEKTASVLALNKENLNLQWFGDTQFVSQPKIGGVFIAAGYKEGNIFYTQIIRSIKLSTLKDRCLAQGKSLPY